MFQGLRTGSRVWVLKKDTMTIEIAEVVDTPQYTTPQQYGYQYNAPCMDFRIRIGEDTFSLKNVPTEACATNSEAMYVAETKEAVMAEIEAIKVKNEKELAKVEERTRIVEACKALLVTHSPDARREAERNKEIDGIKADISELKAMLMEYMSASSPNPSRPKTKEDKSCTGQKSEMAARTAAKGTESVEETSARR